MVRWPSIFRLLLILLAIGADGHSASYVSFTDIASHLDVGTDGRFLGAAWLDYDRDGLHDLFVNNGVGGEVGLFRNLGSGMFENATSSARLNGLAGLSGVVAGDLDNDGFEDLILTGEERVIFVNDNNAVRVLRNGRDGTFADVTNEARISGLQSPGSAALADVDHDGLLDLFITQTGSINRQIQHPSKFYRNNGNFRFTDVTAASGVDTALGACANGFSDYDLDGDVDLFVANCNDTSFAATPMQLFRNDGNFEFTDVSQEAGLEDQRGFWMAVAFADYDNDGDMDVFSTNLGTKNSNQPHGLFENNGDGTFSNVAADVGVAEGEFGWGAAFQDFDNDGFADIAFAGTLGGFVGPGIGNPGRLFANNLAAMTPSKTFSDVSEMLGIDLSDTRTSGVAHADFDNDGFTDLVIVGSDGQESATVVLRNNGNDHHWLGVELIGTSSNRDAVGARVLVQSASLLLTQEVYAGSSFLSSDSKSLRFGLGGDDAVSAIDVFWPSGLHERFMNSLEIDHIIRLVEGDGVAVLLEGEYNNDGIVNTADYTAWRDGLGSIYTHYDYDVWKSNFGKTVTASRAALANVAVPEPASAVLARAGAAIVFLRRCRRTR